MKDWLFLLCLWITGWSSPLFALNFDFQALAGGASGQLSQDRVKSKMSGFEAKISGHVSFFDKIPIAVGPSYSYFRLEDGRELEFRSLEGNFLAAELFLWSPVRFLGIQGYGKWAFLINGTAQRSNGAQEYRYPGLDQFIISGGQLVVGINVSPRPNFALIVEQQTNRLRLDMDMSSEEFRLARVNPAMSSYQIKSLSTLIGLEFSL